MADRKTNPAKMMNELRELEDLGFLSTIPSSSGMESNLPKKR